jgi:glycosyltransferase involved in cell wall biosynthesis
VPGRVLYLASSFLPDHRNGYTIRTFYLVHALKAAGLDVQLATRPGYPWDRRKINLTVPETVDVEGLACERLRSGAGISGPPADYLEAAAAALAEHISARGISIVHAASNHMSALPALIAARRMGCAFVYEVRGLWEFSEAAKKPGWDKTELFALRHALEMQTARGADAVITLGAGLRDELVAGGVAPERIALVPNGTDTNVFSPQPKDAALAGRLGIPEKRLTIGFAGSFEMYEGLEDLLAAIAMLAGRGRDVGFIGVGEGPVRRRLTAQAEKAGLRDRVILPGRVAHAEMRAYYSLMDIAAYARIPARVCDVVTPLKPLEAMAMGKPVVMSSVGGLKELADDGVSALFFEKGSVEDLAAKLESLIADAALREKLGTGARLAAESRRWDNGARTVADIYARLSQPDMHIPT